MPHLALGFDTVASCEGHKDYRYKNIEKSGRYDKEDRICYPWVDFDWHPEPTEKMLKQKEMIELLVKKYNNSQIIVENSRCFLTLRTKSSSLEGGQKAMWEFTKYLIKNWKSSIKLYKIIKQSELLLILLCL